VVCSRFFRISPPSHGGGNLPCCRNSGLAIGSRSPQPDVCCRMSVPTLAQLEAHLRGAADILRGSIDAAEAKMMGFLKELGYLSDGTRDANVGR
jgi:hypothetical protein